MENKNARFRFVSKGKTTMAVGTQGIVLWCADAPNHRALAVKIAKQCTLAGIVIDEKKQSAGSKKPESLLSKIWDRLRFNKIYSGWKGLQEFYQQNFPSWPQVPLLRVPAINSAEAEKFTRELMPAIIMVSGTSLIKGQLLTVPASIGIINLHTGLSPYVKGGPNCTNWCIANNDWHLTGNTVMWLNAGIDSGNIITTERIDIRKASDLVEVQKMVMEHAHDLYLRAVDYLLSTEPPFASVPQQSLSSGNLYLTKMWTADKRKELLKNWKKKENKPGLSEPATIPLPKRSGGV